MAPKEAAADGDRLRKDMAALQDVYAALSGEPDLDRTLRHVVDKVADALGADVCAFLLHDEAAGELVTQPGARGLPEGNEPLLYRVRVDDPLTSSGRVFLSKEPMLSPDAWSDPRVNPRYARLWNYRSLIVAPLAADGRTIGVLRAGCRRAGVFTEDHLRLAMLVAEHAAVVVQNARLYGRVQEDVRELRRLSAAKTEFLSTVSHEILSPLAAVDGFLNVLLEGEDLGTLAPRQKDFISLCARSLERVTLLIHDLLDISRDEAGAVALRPEPMKIGEVLESAGFDHGPAARGKSIALEVRVPPDLPVVPADPERVRQVVDNLVKNALKFTPSGGRVTVSARGAGGEVVVSVKDTGVGLSEEERGKVFERYYRVDGGARPQRGSGLGLAICKSLVERHGGRIWVDSAPGKGADFQFSLPLSPKNASK